MRVFNLTSLNISQEVPKVLFKPININEEYVFFEKLLTGYEDSWSEGIWAYNLNTNQMHRLDSGQHVEFKELYDFDTPQIFWNGTSKIDPNAMYFATITQLGEDEFIEFYQIDLVSATQKTILGFKFPKDTLIYKSMDLLAPGYILFRLSYNEEMMDLDFYDDMYLLDVAEKKYYPVNDELFKINSGQIFISGVGENARVFYEEYYMEEEEQYDFITGDDIELAVELHQDINEEEILNNSIKSILLKDFVEQIKSGTNRIEMQTYDKTEKNGSIRLIGETDRYVYYKKYIYDFVLRQKGDFLSLRNIGNYEVHKIDKNTMTTEFVRNVPIGEEVKTNTKRAYMMKETGFHVKIVDFDTEKVVMDYKKRFVGRAYEELADLINDEYFIVHLDSEDPRVASFMIVDAKNDEMLIAGHDVLVLQDYIFVV